MRNSKVDATFTFSPGIAPDGSELVANMALNVYDLWKDEANLRIESTIVTPRKPPFSNFEWTTTPENMPEGELTPNNVGFAALDAMSAVHKAPTWPSGRIHVQIWRRSARLEIGTLDIVNLGTDSSRVRDQMSGQPSPTHAATATKVGSLPSNVEKRWLGCFTSMFKLAMFSPSYDEVGRMHPPHQDLPFHYPLHCVDYYSTDRILFELYPQAGLYGPYPLIYDTMVKSMLDWVVGVSQGTKDYRNPMEIKHGEVLLLRLTVMLNPAPNDVTATA